MPITQPTVFTVGGRPEYPAYVHKTEEERTIARIVNNILAGKMNCVADFTLPAGTTELIIGDDRVNPFSFISILPVDSVAAEMQAYAVAGDRQFEVKANTVAPIWAGMIASTPAIYSSSEGNPTKIVDFVASGQSDHTNAIVLDPINGNVTLNFEGDYRLNFRTSFLAATARNYSWWISRNGSFDPGDAAARSVALIGGSEETQISIDFIFSAQPGDVLSAYIENHFATMNDDDVFSSYFETVHVGSTAPISSDEDANFRYVVLG